MAIADVLNESKFVIALHSFWLLCLITISLAWVLSI